MRPPSARRSLRRSNPRTPLDRSGQLGGNGYSLRRKRRLRPRNSELDRACAPRANAYGASSPYQCVCRNRIATRDARNWTPGGTREPLCCRPACIGASPLFPVCPDTKFRTSRHLVISCGTCLSRNRRTQCVSCATLPTLCRTRNACVFSSFQLFIESANQNHAPGAALCCYPAPWVTVRMALRLPANRRRSAILRREVRLRPHVSGRRRWRWQCVPKCRRATRLGRDR